MAEQDLASFQYQTVFISDTHLGSNKTSSPYLYEFLKHLDFKALKKLYLVGDIFGGWEHQSNRQQPLPEMEKRILDVLNYAADQGVKIHFTPGNHDEKLRPLVDMLQNRKNFRTFHENIVFAQKTVYETEGPDKKKFDVLHGDQNDPGLFVKPWFRPFANFVSWTYDRVVDLNYHTSGFLYKRFGLQVNFAKALKHAFKNTVNFIFSHKSLLKGLEKTDRDGLIMGHTHHAGIQVFTVNGRTSWLINDGDWVESRTAAYVGPDGGIPKILDYDREREKRGFGDLPDENDPHPAHFAALRDRTERQVRMLHRVWPARNRADCVAAYRHADAKIESYGQDRKNLRAVFDALETTGRIAEPARRNLTRILEDTDGTSYKAQKKGLRTIFNAYAADAPLRPDDQLFARTVIREFMTRCDRKIKKHAKALNSAGRKLDFRTGTGGGTGG